MATVADTLPGEPSIEPLLLVTIDGVIETCNEAFASLCGAPSRDLPGRRMESLISEHLSEYLRACARSETPLAASFTLRSRSGTSEHRFYGLAHRTQPGPTPPRVRLVLRPVVTPDGDRAALAEEPGTKQLELPAAACASVPQGAAPRHDLSLHEASSRRRAGVWKGIFG